MRSNTGSYVGYSVGCAIVWAIILIISSFRHEDPRTIRLVFGGWAVGWTSATIARYVYPPPKRARRTPAHSTTGGPA